uniref:Uncharacterized mitochondrial protein AtMg00810-like n=1 Tax=Nicotiana tabacum TaxID=4097 RepID=A0A1S4CTB5_TOBAC|nr:PREDICTED: uncharacterized mitochondrial protein AtMg00810-like [Nicotiana tabacum]
MGLLGSKPVRVPLEVNKKLTTLEFDTQFGIEDDKVLDDPSVYQRLIGKLLYLTMTRPNIAFAVQCLSQFMHCPKTSYIKADIKVIKYIKQSPGMRILMSADVSSQLTAYCDADWDSCPNISNSAIQIAANPVFHERTKHIHIECHFIREKVQLGLVHLLHLPFSEQQAYILTKGLGVTQHYYFLSKLGMKSIFMAPSLRGCEAIRQLPN